ncbi:MAG: PLAT/LH2 domain-containing protein [Bacteroidota bacterium]
MHLSTHPLSSRVLLQVWALLLIYSFTLLTACQNNTKPPAEESQTAEPAPPQKSIAPLPSTPPEPEEYQGPTTYEVMFRTGCDEDAGTKAKIYMTMFGSKGQSKEMYLNQTQKENFISCSADEFEIPVEENFGSLQKLVVRHDNTGENPNWLVEIIRVKDLKSGVRYDFPCGKWLDKEDGDNKISRDFPITRECR